MYSKIVANMPEDAFTDNPEAVQMREDEDMRLVLSYVAPVATRMIHEARTPRELAAVSRCAERVLAQEDNPIARKELLESLSLVVSDQRHALAQEGLDS